MSTDLEQAYQHCQRVAKEHASNFYYAFRTLPAHKRRAIYSAYAYCRLCDDIADGDMPIEAKRKELNRVRQHLADALSPARPPAHSPEFHALGDAARTFNIPVRYFEEVIDGVESDLTKTRFADFSELRTYCYKVASVVGLICIEIFGYREPKAREYAVDMGIALQLTNIMRDLKEDAERDRIYIPQEDLDRFGYSEDNLMRGVVSDEIQVPDEVPGRPRALLLRKLPAAVRPDRARVPRLSAPSTHRVRRDPRPHRGLRVRRILPARGP